MKNPPSYSRELVRQEYDKFCGSLYGDVLLCFLRQPTEVGPCADYLRPLNYNDDRDLRMYERAVNEDFQKILKEKHGGVKEYVRFCYQIGWELFSGRADRVRVVRKFTKTDRSFTMDSEAYTHDGKVWRWVSNNSICPLDACKEYGIPVDAAEQEKAREVEVDAVCSAYRQYRRDHGYSAEEMFEMRAAFGQDADVVDVVTGHRFKTRS